MLDGDVLNVVVVGVVVGIVLSVVVVTAGGVSVVAIIRDCCFGLKLKGSCCCC